MRVRRDDAYGQPAGLSHRCSAGRRDRECDTHRPDCDRDTRCDRGADRAPGYIGTCRDSVTCANRDADRRRWVRRDALHRPG